MIRGIGLRTLSSSQVSEWRGSRRISIPSGGGLAWVGHPITVTSHGAYYGSAANVWDNDDSTGWNTGDAGVAWTIADFGVPVYASQITALAASSSGTWTLSGSNDATSWTTIRSDIVATVSTPTTYLFAGQSWRHWRMTQSGAWKDPLSFTLAG